MVSPRRIYFVPSICWFSSTRKHFRIKLYDAVATGPNEEKGQHCVHDARDSSDDHANPAGTCNTQVLKVRFSDGRGMLRE
jgi:hypothetical protein